LLAATPLLAALATLAALTGLRILLTGLLVSAALSALAALLAALILLLIHECLLGLVSLKAEDNARPQVTFLRFHLNCVLHSRVREQIK
jgi:hypothetical protein